MTARVLKVIVAVVAAGLAVAVATTILAGQGLDRAEKWVSISGVVIGAIGTTLAWLAWRRPVHGSRSARRTGDATATGAGSLANTGLLGDTDATATATGDAKAERGGHANTGAGE
ncbi:hypothetical protein FB565_007249 [Actinoplanes lutulentus]|uniref:hypothetical protein n=1 Tax=Actinoplanes lutulentus TaxID=1287878 RepID=UPI0011B93539|nr:hypothetical protein [Actinoplanes lutulentus]MBB2947478.1 hypothetical protein [Actinoplanes lutulentus]